MAQEEEELSWIEDEAVGEAIQSEPAQEIDMGGLTPIRSWPPDSPSYPDFYRFKHAAVCHDRTANDVYGIAAVFNKKWGGYSWDALYYLRIDGNSTHPTYGQILTETFVASSTSIDNVDCTTNNGTSVFIAYDRYNADARWVRFIGTTMYGPYTIVGVDWCDELETYSTRMPRIAFSNSASPIVMIAFYAHDYFTGGDSCEICTHTYWAYTGEFIHEEMFWPDTGNQPITWDVEWNGDNKFIMGYFTVPDSSDPAIKLRSAKFRYDGHLEAINEIENFSDGGEHPPMPNEIKLAYTDGNLNSMHRFILQSGDGATWWLEQSGIRAQSIDNPRYDYGGRYDEHFAVCEYWGSFSNRIAHTFGYNYSVFPPVFNTRHMHWDQYYIAGSPYEVDSLNNGYFPAACSAADTLTDTELMLVSSAASGSKYVYWNMGYQ